MVNFQPTDNGIHVLLTNRATMQATHTTELDIPALPLKAQKSHVFSTLASGSVLSKDNSVTTAALYTSHNITFIYFTKEKLFCKAAEQVSCGQSTKINTNNNKYLPLMPQLVIQQSPRESSSSTHPFFLPHSPP